ncbi:unnamed protein product [Penicillium roqueforti FM164]|uniref:Genomic scaffold, ProqFM164S02 n=1 Tax=Penicillium roqueforti (strain FM164) TaxID=1365484 RepID=W6Q8X9_PENRF|nr:unnamed protein product [Penicillium roqueforti FM164]
MENDVVPADSFRWTPAFFRLDKSLIAASRMR